MSMSKRQSVNFPGFSHSNPIPNASRIGNLMMSSVISGRDPKTNELPADMAQQIVNIFIHLRSAVTAAGGTPDDILKVDFFMKDPVNGRAALNGEWEKMFPDAESRPARHTQHLPGDGASHVSCNFTAVFS
jgi:2-iminobutanoate/2-iminopropanoate deaminase